MAFQTGLSGLNAASSELDVIGNNVANASTVGFKGSRSIFSDVFASSLSGGGASSIGIGTKVSGVQQQFTQGNINVTNNPLDLAINGGGFFRMDQNGSVTYSRNGQFHSDSNGFLVNSSGLQLTGYTVDSVGNIVPSSPLSLQLSTADIPPNMTTKFQGGLNLDSRSVVPPTQTQGSLTGTGGAIAFPVTITGSVNDTIDLTLNGAAGTATIAAATYNNSTQLAAAVQTAINAVPAFAGFGYSATVSANASVMTITSGMIGNGSTVTVTGGTAQATLKLGTSTTIAGLDNFSTGNPQSFTSSTSGTVFDSLGNSHVFTMYFSKSQAAGDWDVRATVDGTALANVDLGAGAGNPITLTFSTSGVLTTPMPIQPVALTIAGGAASPLSIDLDFRGSTQFGSSFNVNLLTQDGYTSGHLNGFNVGVDGKILGQYSNGQARTLGQVVLVDFANPEGLIPLGNNQWQESSATGLPVIGTPGSGSVGTLQSAAVESSNVDLTAELVNMITAQRNYQANAQSIKTQDAVLQTLVNMR